MHGRGRFLQRAPRRDRIQERRVARRRPERTQRNVSALPATPLAGTQTEWHGPETDNACSYCRGMDSRPMVTVGDQMGPYLVRLLQIKRAYLPYGVELLTLTRLFQIKNVFKQNAFALEEDTFEATLSQLLRLQSPVHSFLSMRIQPPLLERDEANKLAAPSPGLMSKRVISHYFIGLCTMRRVPNGTFRTGVTLFRRPIRN